MDKKRQVLLHALSILEKPPVADNFLINTPNLKREIGLQMILDYGGRPANTSYFPAAFPNLKNSVLHSRWEAIRMPKP